MMKEEVNTQREKIIYKVTWFGFFVNLFLAAPTAGLSGGG